MSGTNSHQHLRYNPSQMYHVSQTQPPPPPTIPPSTPTTRGSHPVAVLPLLSLRARPLAERPAPANQRRPLTRMPRPQPLQTPRHNCSQGPAPCGCSCGCLLHPVPEAAIKTPQAHLGKHSRNEENAAMNKSPAAPPPVRLWRWSTSFLTSLASTYTPPHPTDLHNTHSPSQWAHQTSSPTAPRPSPAG